MKVAFLGLGIMGSRMAVHLVDAGHELRAWTRTADKAEQWAAEHGALAAGTPAEAATGADAVISIVPGTLFVDMSTIAPAAAVEIADALSARGHRFLDAPVTGSSPAAESGTLTIMVGGAEPDLDEARPLFEAMGRKIVHVGPSGHGQLVKLLNNSFAAANALTAAQALVAGRALGVDLDRLIEVLGAGSGASAMLALKAGPFLQHDYSTLFKTEHMLKDVRHCLDALAHSETPFPAAEHAADALAAAVAEGHGDEDFASLLAVVEERAGIRL
jgi:3-hydroxyisobutyrate dehydrogenase-like beta-hydroxyacid dehydrogenase